MGGAGGLFNSSNPFEMMNKMQNAMDPQMKANLNRMGGMEGLLGGGGGGMIENMMESMGMGKPPPGVV